MSHLDTESALQVAVIVGSTRQGRVGDAVAGWVVEQIAPRRDVAVDVIDLADFDFPDRHPAEPTPQTAKFAAAIGRADAFVVVTPEYNRSFPASLKQAIDYAYDEWHAKPVGFAAYGCDSRGIYAVEQLRVVFTELHAVTMRQVVSFDLLGGDVDDDGRPKDTPKPQRAVAALLSQLVWWGRALRTACAAEPYAG